MTHTEFQGTQREGAKTFFIQAAEFAGLELSPLLKRRSRTSFGKKKKQPKLARTEEAKIDRASVNNLREESVTIQLSGSVTLTITLAGSLIGLKKQDRDFAFGIIDSVDAYERSESSES